MTHPPSSSLRTFGLLALLLVLSAPFDAHARHQRLSQTYSATLVASELKGLGEITPENLTGIWLVQFLPGEALSIIHDGEIVIEGDWAFENGTLKLTRMSGFLVCGNENADTAVYNVSIRGFSISFEAAVETCPERAALLTRGVFRASAR